MHDPARIFADELPGGHGSAATSAHLTAPPCIRCRHCATFEYHEPRRIVRWYCLEPRAQGCSERLPPIAHARATTGPCGPAATLFTPAITQPAPALPPEKEAS